MSQRLYFPFVLIGVAGLTFLLTVSLGPKQASAIIQVASAPQGTSVSINGKSSSVGKNSVAPGDYIVEVSKTGFATQTKKITLSDNQVAYIDMVLDPNDSTTKDWYTNNPSDQTLAEGISSQAADRNNAGFAQFNPFLNSLPLSFGNGHRGFTNVAQGVPVAGSTQPAIYVSADTASDRRDVLNYIRSHGYDPANMDIVFIGAPSPLSDGGE